MEIKIKASELRIGNYYNHNEEIRQVTPNTILEVWESEREWCKPIPLTEEWLLKFGFEHSKPNYWFKNDNKLRFSLIDNNLHCSMGDDDYGILYNRLNHVHQLQNLYFALTNEELTWK